MPHRRWYIIPENLKLFRGPGTCSYCHKLCQTREPHHIIAKGLGGIKPPGDARINLIALGSSLSMECPCHSRIHSHPRPKVIRAELIELVAAREGKNADIIVTALNSLVCCTKDTTEEDLRRLGLWRLVYGPVLGKPAVLTGSTDEIYF